MDRRSFFKSSALWLAGLMVAPHLKLDLVTSVGRGSTWMLDNLGTVISIEVPHPDKYGEFIKVGEIRKTH